MLHILSSGATLTTFIFNFILQIYHLLTDYYFYIVLLPTTTRFRTIYDYRISNEYLAKQEQHDIIATQQQSGKTSPPLTPQPQRHSFFQGLLTVSLNAFFAPTMISILCGQPTPFLMTSSPMFITWSLFTVTWFLPIRVILFLSKWTRWLTCCTGTIFESIFVMMSIETACRASLQFRTRGTILFDTLSSDPYALPSITTISVPTMLICGWLAYHGNNMLNQLFSLHHTTYKFVTPVAIKAPFSGSGKIGMFMLILFVAFVSLFVPMEMYTSGHSPTKPFLLPTITLTPQQHNALFGSNNNGNPIEHDNSNHNNYNDINDLDLPPVTITPTVTSNAQNNNSNNNNKQYIHVTTNDSNSTRNNSNNNNNNQGMSNNPNHHSHNPMLVTENVELCIQSQNRFLSFCYHDWLLSFCKEADHYSELLEKLNYSELDDEKNDKNNNKKNYLMENNNEFEILPIFRHFIPSNLLLKGYYIYYEIYNEMMCNVALTALHITGTKPCLQEDQLKPIELQLLKDHQLHPRLSQRVLRTFYEHTNTVDLYNDNDILSLFLPTTQTTPSSSSPVQPQQQQKATTSISHIYATTPIEQVGQPVFARMIRNTWSLIYTKPLQYIVSYINQHLQWLKIILFKSLSLFVQALPQSYTQHLSTERGFTYCFYTNNNNTVNNSNSTFIQNNTHHDNNSYGSLSLLQQVIDGINTTALKTPSLTTKTTTGSIVASKPGANTSEHVNAIEVIQLLKSTLNYTISSGVQATIVNNNNNMNNNLNNIDQQNNNTIIITNNNSTISHSTVPVDTIIVNNISNTNNTNTSQDTSLPSSSSTTTSNDHYPFFENTNNQLLFNNIEGKYIYSYDNLNIVGKLRLPTDTLFFYHLPMIDNIIAIIPITLSLCKGVFLFTWFILHISYLLFIHPIGFKSLYHDALETLILKEKLHEKEQLLLFLKNTTNTTVSALQQQNKQANMTKQQHKKPHNNAQSTNNNNNNNNNSHEHNDGENQKEKEQNITSTTKQRGPNVKQQQQQSVDVLSDNNKHKKNNNNNVSSDLSTLVTPEAQ